MTRHILTPLVLFLFLSSCDSMRSYKYVEIVREESLGVTSMREKDAKIIKAATDSAAYLDAYQSFCISIKVSNDMKESFGTIYSTPKEFKLFNDKNIDITKSTFFADKERKEKEIESQIFSMNNTIQESIDRNQKEKSEFFKQKANVDSTKAKKLDKYFTKRKDEFSNDNKIWYTPSNAPKYTNRNGIYFYFQTENDMPGNLRFRLQYYSDDWLFFHKVQFSIDGKSYDYIPLDTENDSGDGGYIWEWFDQPVSASDKELINALANAKSAKMKLIGRQYYDVKTISKEQINSFKNTLEMFQALGGNW